METSVDKFALFTSESQKSQKNYADLNHDDASGLNAKKKMAWAQMLSSVASAEATEEMIMKPLIKNFSRHPLLKEYFASHAMDEFLHAKAIKNYISGTFSYEKKKKTLSDKVIYEGLFAMFSKWAGQRPVAFIAALLFYESYSERFYDRLQKSAMADGLPNLHKLIQQIEKDELRHRAGLKLILKNWKSLGFVADQLDYWLAKILIQTVIADVNTSPLAIYNQHVRKNMIDLNLGPDELFAHAKEYGKLSLMEIKKLLNRKN